jgi:hypothetical protein
MSQRHQRPPLGCSLIVNAKKMTSPKEHNLFANMHMKESPAGTHAPVIVHEIALLPVLGKDL